MTAQDIRIIAPDELGKWLDEILASYTVIAPVRQGTYTNFSVISSSDQVDMKEVNARTSPKNLFFPKTERLFGFASDRQQVDLDGQEPEISPQVLFGTRPCDARAVTMLDLVFDTDTFRDSRYVARRQATTIVTFACKQLAASCFCTRVGSNPADAAGSDIIVVELADGRLAIRPLTAKGQDLLKTASLPSTACEPDLAAFEEALDTAKQAADEAEPIKPQELAEKLAKIYDSDFWDRDHQRCLGCGTCTYLCPTCHCFDIADEAKDRTGQRVRNWDSCMFSLFTLHASGHNPRNIQKPRLRQRVMHKFSYTVDRYNQAFCVGCGRCVTRCSVNIDIRQILKELEEYAGG